MADEEVILVTIGAIKPFKRNINNRITKRIGCFRTHHTITVT